MKDLNARNIYEVVMDRLTRKLINGEPLDNTLYEAISWGVVNIDGNTSLWISGFEGYTIFGGGTALLVDERETCGQISRYEVEKGTLCKRIGTHKDIKGNPLYQFDEITKAEWIEGKPTSPQGIQIYNESDLLREVNGKISPFVIVKSHRELIWEWWSKGKSLRKYKESQ
jgi:hypothetical protein